MSGKNSAKKKIPLKNIERYKYHDQEFIPFDTLVQEVMKICYPLSNQGTTHEFDSLTFRNNVRNLLPEQATGNDDTIGNSPPQNVSDESGHESGSTLQVQVTSCPEYIWIPVVNRVSYSIPSQLPILIINQPNQFPMQSLYPQHQNIEQLRPYTNDMMLGQHYINENEQMQYCQYGYIQNTAEVEYPNQFNGNEMNGLYNLTTNESCHNVPHQND